MNIIIGDSLLKNVKLPKRFKEKWVKALRSGEYEQGKDFLYDSFYKSYCCLGVACKITNPKLHIDELRLISEDDFPGELKLIKVPKILKGSNDESEKDYNSLVDTLSRFNDNGKSFKWIASYIERYL